MFIYMARFCRLKLQIEDKILMKSTEKSQVTQDPVTCPICGRTCAYQKELDRHLVEV